MSLHSNLIDLDPGLGALLGEERLPAARQHLAVKVMHLPQGPWETDVITAADPSNLGLLIIDGALARDIVIGGNRSTELLGPGDLFRPWELHESETLVPYLLEWTVLDTSRIAVLGRDTAAQLARYPEVGAVLFERMSVRSRRLALERAIATLNHVELRVRFLMWHLAERWGRVTCAGVVVPVTLSHRMIGQIVGARRPTVSLAVGKLREQGELERREDGTWLLTGDPPSPPDDLERILPRRRTFQSRTPVTTVSAALDLATRG